MQKWEYLQVEYRQEKQIMDGLNSYGQEGWELVAVTFEQGRHVTGMSQPGVPEMESWKSWQVFLKRPK